MKKITLNIDGMACSMCEAHVNDAIRKAFKVNKVNSSAKKGESVILSDEVIPEASIKSALDPTGYRLTGYKVEDYEKKGLFGLFK